MFLNIISYGGKNWFYFLDLQCLWTLYANAVGATIYIPKFSAITEMPNANTSVSEPLSANVIIDNEEIIGVMNSFVASLKTGFCLSQSAIVGENE